MQLSEVELWLDMQLSPQLAKWIQEPMGIKATSSYDLFINDEKDEIIFLKAKEKRNVIILSKDNDFVVLSERLQPPPKIIWLTMGNCPNKQMKVILTETLILSVRS